MIKNDQSCESVAVVWCDEWQPRIVDWVAEQMQSADSGHGIDHVRRVVENAKKIGLVEQANANIYLPAAWLHDCVIVPKNSPLRRTASALAAQNAERFLAKIAYPSNWIDPISHCILAHSFSANVPCETIEAKVVQDSDRLEAVGAIGLARCLMTGGAMGQRLYHPSEPFPANRLPADTEQSVDHFFAKLLGLQRTMQTESGRDEARRRSKFLVVFLRQLAEELGASPSALETALQRVV
ncbi:MAG TPA: HD domain-containing protein [Pirellula sp.]|nr:HD domain-containing protein [Pirellula sp.]